MACGCRAHSGSNKGTFSRPKVCTVLGKTWGKVCEWAGKILAVRGISYYLPDFPAKSTDALQGYKGDEQF